MEETESGISDTKFKQSFEEKLREYEINHQGSFRKPWTNERIEEVISNVKIARVSMTNKECRTSMSYYWLSKYDVMTTGNKEYLIFKRNSPEDRTIRIIPREEYFNILNNLHKECGHGGRDKVSYAVKSRYYIAKKAIEIFVALCPTCNNKRNFPRKGIVTRPIVSKDFNIRGQVDLIDFQSCPDGEYKWLLNYQDNATKFLNLRPLKTKRASEVAAELMKIFLIFGAPYILQSDNGREFTAKVIEELVSMWPECKIVHGSPRRPQTQGSVERSNQDVENMIRAWMTDKDSTNWSVGCYFCQYQKNSSFHRIIGRSPYKALFGSDPKAGLSGTNIPSQLLLTIETEEQLKNLTDEPSDDINLSTATPNNETQIAETLHQQYACVTEPASSNNETIVHGVFEYCDNPNQTENVNFEVDKVVDVVNEPSTSNVTHSYNAKPKYCDDLNQNENVNFETNEGVVSEPYSSNLTSAYNTNIDNNTDQASSLLDNIENFEPNLICVICQQPTSGAHSCRSCNNAVHVICGVSEGGEEGYGARVLCLRCKTEESIIFQRNEAHKGIKRAADKMVENTAKKIPPLALSNTVLISVPKFDRGPLDTKNIKGKIVDVRNGVYRVGTKTGTIKNWFARQDLHPIVEIYDEDILNTPITLREAVTNESKFGGQGFQKCSCKPAQKQCRTLRCACFKKKNFCGSKCHSSLSCVNK